MRINKDKFSASEWLLKILKVGKETGAAMGIGMDIRSLPSPAEACESYAEALGRDPADLSRLERQQAVLNAVIDSYKD